jgi:hypothetical protein
METSNLKNFPKDSRVLIFFLVSAAVFFAVASNSKGQIEVQGKEINWNGSDCNRIASPSVEVGNENYTGESTEIKFTGEIPVRYYYREYSHEIELVTSDETVYLKAYTSDNTDFDAHVECVEGSHSLNYTAKFNLSKPPRKVKVLHNGEKVKEREIR